MYTQAGMAIFGRGQTPYMYICWHLCFPCIYVYSRTRAHVQFNYTFGMQSTVVYCLPYAVQSMSIHITVRLIPTWLHTQVLHIMTTIKFTNYNLQYKLYIYQRMTKVISCIYIV